MTDTNLPPSPDGMGEISERLQEYNQKVQEQAFLLGYRNGFRESEMMQDLLAHASEQKHQAETAAERAAWRQVEHYLQQQGATITDEDEITHPPGLLFYIGAFEAQPFVQVAGERIHIEDLDFQWDPMKPSSTTAYDGFEPANESGTIELQFHLDLPEDSEEREALMQFLEGLR